VKAQIEAGSYYDIGISFSNDLKAIAGMDETIELMNKWIDAWENEEFQSIDDIAVVRACKQILDAATTAGSLYLVPLRDSFRSLVSGTWYAASNVRAVIDAYTAYRESAINYISN
jgi:hypothetical protein